MSNTIKEEMEAIVENVLEQFSLENTSTKAQIVEAFCNIKEPEGPGMEYITLDFGSRGSRTTKPGNIALNWQKLLRKIPEIGLTAKEFPQGGLIAILAALYVWNSVWSLLQIELTKKHAVVMYVMWTNRDSNYKIPENVAFEKTREFLAENEEDAGWLSEFSQVVNDLVRMKCIELNDGIIWMREWVRKVRK